MLWQIIQIIFPVFAVVLSGYLYGRKFVPDLAAANRLNIDLFIPALIFDVLTSKNFDIGAYRSLAVGGVSVVLGSLIVAWPIAHWMGYRAKTFLPPMMFNNSGNLGLPLMVFAFGEKALPAAVVLFIIENTLHFSVGMKMLNASASLLSLFRVPMLVATIVGLALSLTGLHPPQLIVTPIKMLGQIAIPLLLFALGVRLIHINWQDWKVGLIGAIVSPLSGLAIALAASYLLHLPQQQAALLILFGALPPAVLNYLVAERYQQQPQLVASIVLMGNLAALLVIPLVLAFILNR